MIWRQQTAGFGHDAVAVMISIAGERNIEFIFQCDESLHRVRRGRIHANLSIPIDAHKTKCGIYGFVDDRQIESILLGDARPIIDACSPERIYTELDFGVAYRI